MIVIMLALLCNVQNVFCVLEQKKQNTLILYSVEDTSIASAGEICSKLDMKEKFFPLFGPQEVSSFRKFIEKALDNNIEHIHVLSCKGYQNTDNFFASLENYEENKGFFKETLVDSKEKAELILNKLYKGPVFFDTDTSKFLEAKNVQRKWVKNHVLYRQMTFDEEEYKKSALVYLHGFGEGMHINASKLFSHLSKNIVIPNFPDAGGALQRGVFYTKPAVHCAANTLATLVETEKIQSLHMVGRSCGGGISLSLLKELNDYSETTNYFKDTQITSKKVAQNILQTIDKGSLVLTAPLLGLKKAQAVNMSSYVLAKGALFGLSGIAYYCGLHTFLPPLTGIPGSVIAHHPLATLCLGSWFLNGAFGSPIKERFALSIDRFAVPFITSGHYNPSDIKPIDAVKHLKGVLPNCPKLLHFNTKDGVLMDPDEDTVAVYEAFADQKTHIVLSSSFNSNHNLYNKTTKKVFHQFSEKYFEILEEQKDNLYDKKDCKTDTLTDQSNQINEKPKVLLPDTQPTVDEFRKRVNPTRLALVWGFFKSLFGFFKFF